MHLVSGQDKQEPEDNNTTNWEEATNFFVSREGGMNFGGVVRGREHDQHVMKFSQN